jgi:hypothetical protein
VATREREHAEEAPHAERAIALLLGAKTIRRCVSSWTEQATLIERRDGHVVHTRTGRP